MLEIPRIDLEGSSRPAGAGGSISPGGTNQEAVSLPIGIIKISES